MIDFSTLSFDNIVGWRQHYNGSITESITTSLSGLFVQDEHPYCSYEMVKAITDEYVYPAWMAGTYKKGMIVTHSGTTKRCKSTTTENPTNVTYWETYDKISNFIYDLIKSESLSTVQDFYTQKFMTGAMKDLIKSDFPLNQYGVSKITNTGDIAGIVITPINSTMQKMQIDGVKLHFSANCTVTLKLYKENAATPTLQQSITYVKNTPYTALTAWVLEAGTPYYICYDQSEIENAYNDEVDQAYLPNGNILMEGQNYAIQGFKNSDAGFDRQYDSYDAVSHGISPLIRVYCDYTSFFNTNKLSFAQAINTKVAIRILNEILSNANTRVNRFVEIAKDGRLQYEIDGDPNGKKENNMGLKAKYERHINSIIMDTSSIDKVCLTCKPSRVRYGAV